MAEQTLWDRQASVVDPDVTERLSRMVTGNDALVAEPGLVQALFQNNATPQQAGAINQFMAGLNAEQKVRTASASNQKVRLSPLETTALDAMGIDYAPVQYTYQDAKADLTQKLAAQGLQPVKDANGNIQLDADHNVVVEKIPQPEEHRGFFGTIGHAFSSAGHAALGALNKAWNVTDTTLANTLQDFKESGSDLLHGDILGAAKHGLEANPLVEAGRELYRPTDEQAADMRAQGYEPGNPFSAISYISSGHAYNDTSKLADHWDKTNPGGKYGWSGQQAVDQAKLFAVDPGKYAASIYGDASLTPDQIKQKHDAINSPEFQSLVARVQSQRTDVGAETALGIGIDPVKHPDLFTGVSAGTNLAVSFVADPTVVGLQALSTYQRSTAAIRSLTDAGGITRTLLPAAGAHVSLSQGRAIKALQDMVDHTGALRAAINSGDAAEQARIMGRINANPFGGLAGDFLGTDQILRVKSAEEMAGLKKGDLPFVTGQGKAIETYDDAVTYLASKGALARLQNGFAPIESTVMPGALSSRTYLKIKGSLGAWSAGRSYAATEAGAAKLADSLRGADPGRIQAILDRGALLHTLPGEDDAVDVLSGRVLAAQTAVRAAKTEEEAAAATTDLASARRGLASAIAQSDAALVVDDTLRGVVQGNVRRYGTAVEPSTALGKVASIYTLGAARRAGVIFTRLTNWLPRTNYVRLDSSADADTIRKVARTFLTGGDSNMLAVRWTLGDMETRKTIVQGLQDQIAHGAGLTRTKAGREMVDGWHTAYENQRYLLTDEGFQDVNGVMVGMYPGQMRNMFQLPNFGSVHQAAARVGLYEATMGRLFTGAGRVASGMQKLLVQWKLMALLSGTTAARANLESWLNAAADNGFSFMDAVRTKALLREHGLLDGALVHRSAPMDKLLSFAPLRQAGHIYRHLLLRNMDDAEAAAIVGMADDLRDGYIADQAAFHQAMQLDPGGVEDITKAAEAGFRAGATRYRDGQVLGEGHHRNGFEITDEVDAANGARLYAFNLALRVNKEPGVAKAIIRAISGGEQGVADEGRVLYHGGLPPGTELEDIDLGRLGSQQNRRERTYGGFYLTDESSRSWAEHYAAQRGGMIHAFRLHRDARIGDLGRQNIDRLNAAERKDLALQYDVVKGVDTLGRAQYVLLNKAAVADTRKANVLNGGQSGPAFSPVDDVIAELEASPHMRQSLFGRVFLDETGAQRRAMDLAESALGKRQWAEMLIKDFEGLTTGRNGVFQSDLAKYIVEHDAAPSDEWILEHVKKLNRPAALLKPIIQVVPDKPGVGGLFQQILDKEGRGYQWLVERLIQRHATSPLFHASYAKERVALEDFKQGLIRDAGIPDEAAERATQTMAAQRAWDRIARMVDDPHMRSQMDIVGRSFFAFSRATTMMLRRWGSTFWRNPQQARRLQLATEAAIQSGFVYADPTTGDWMFHFPASGVAQEVLMHAMSNIPGMHEMFMFPAADFTGRVASIVPGSSNPFQYSTNPIVSIAGRSIASLFPAHRELFDEVDRRLNGSQGQGQGFFATLEPTLYKKLVDSDILPFLPGADDSRNSLISSALVGSIYNTYAAGMFPKNPSPSDLDTLTGRLQTGMKSILFLRGTLGAFSPATLAEPGVAGMPADYAFAVQGAQGMRDEFKMLLDETDGDYARALAVWTAIHPDLPVYTESGSAATTSHAIMPATDAALSWMNDHQDFIGKYKNVAAYFIPEQSTGEPFSMAAYRAQLEEGLRQRKTPEEFLSDAYYATAASQYYPMYDKYQADLLAAKASGDTDLVREREADWTAWSNKFKAQHLVFAARTDASAANAADALNKFADLKSMVKNGDVPNGLAPAVAGMVQAYEGYTEFAHQHSGGTNVATAARQAAFAALQDYLTSVVKVQPGLADIYNGVLRPLSGYHLSNEGA